MRLKIASLAVLATVAGLGVTLPPTPAEAKYPTPWIRCMNQQRDICTLQHPGDEAAIEACVAGREDRCAGMEGDPNNPPPGPNCHWLGSGMWYCEVP